MAAKLHYDGRWYDDGRGAVVQRRIVAQFTQKNDPIYQKDSDFEVFVDLAGANSAYKELEINALNTVWNLMLNRPYSEGGEEFSGRVAVPRENASDPRYWGVTKQKTAAVKRAGRSAGPEGEEEEWWVD